jgi:hypothetical protein
MLQIQVKLAVSKDIRSTSPIVVDEEYFKRRDWLCECEPNAPPESRRKPIGLPGHPVNNPWPSNISPGTSPGINQMFSQPFFAFVIQI